MSKYSRETMERSVVKGAGSDTSLPALIITQKKFHRKSPQEIFEGYVSCGKGVFESDKKNIHMYVCMYVHTYNIYIFIYNKKFFRFLPFPHEIMVI